MIRMVPLDERRASRRASAWGDAVVLALVASVLWFGVVLARRAPAVIRAPELATVPGSLLIVASFSLGRMAAAYALSIAFTFVYGRLATRDEAGGRPVALGLLDVFQSVPILSFLPVVLLALVAVLPEGLAVESAAVVLLFTSQTWNLTFAWLQSRASVPRDLSEVATSFGLGPWLRFRRLELPHAAISLVWNSMMSWSGGWFFLMAAESFRVGARDFRLPGLGSYLQVSTERGDVHRVALGVAVLVLMIVSLDQLVWRPLGVWAQRFKTESVRSADEPRSWFFDVLSASHLAGGMSRVGGAALERIDRLWLARERRVRGRPRRSGRLVGALGGVLAGAVAYGAWRAGMVLMELERSRWVAVGLGLAATFGRVLTTLVFALGWTLPAGVAIGTHRRLATFLQPVVEVAAAVPATALFPILIAALLRMPLGDELSAIALMSLGTQWYLLFNVIAGVSAIPEDLRHTARLLGVHRLAGGDERGGRISRGAAARRKPQGCRRIPELRTLSLAHRAGERRGRP